MLQDELEPVASAPGVTHAAIAARLGISRAAVTQALHRTRSSNLRPELRQQILEMARQMSYRPRNVTTHTLGVLLLSGQLLNAADAVALAHLERAAARRGYRLAIIDPEGPLNVSLGDIINRKTVDGVFLTYWNSGRYWAALAPDLPCLLMSEEDDLGAEIDQVGFDLVGMVSGTLQYLQSHGHERFCLITGLPHGNYYERMQNAAQCAREALGIAESDLILVQAHPSHCAAPVIEIMQQSERPTAFICTDNYHLFPVYCELLAAGYRIPDEVSIMSLVDDDLCRIVNPAITATNIIGTAMAERMVERLVARIEDPALPPKRQFFAGEIIERASVGPCPASRANPGKNRRIE